MWKYGLVLLTRALLAASLNLDFLDPVKLQTKTSPTVQRDAAVDVIHKYLEEVIVEVNPSLFHDNKDVFQLYTFKDRLYINASTGVAAVWGFNYYLKKYCKSQIAWQVKRVAIPTPLPHVDETVIANDRFRYYQNVCTFSYSFVWWDILDWKNHLNWMALNGINIALAPIAQEAAWKKVYREIGMTNEEIDEHFTGPAFLSWFRMGNLRGWGGPLLESWHYLQQHIKDFVIDYMFKLGMIPVFPAFSGHVPVAFSRIYPNTTFYNVNPWNRFKDEYCCGLFLDPNEALFKTIGKMFHAAFFDGIRSSVSHIYTMDPFNEVKIQPWSTALVKDTAKAIYSTISEMDYEAVWLLQNWMFVHDLVIWPKDRVKAFLTSVPNGRLLILDLQSEQWPKYDVYDMYYGQPFIWCMLHNFGGTLGMFGNMQTVNKDVYEVRSRVNSSMIGVGLTNEGINQNYVVYDLMLESAWRKSPINDMDEWVADYAERRYGCTSIATGWKHLLRSVYSFDGQNKMRGKYVITRRPSFNIKPWAWYRSHDLFEAFKHFALFNNSGCEASFNHDLVDVTRQALQYRAEQIYINMVESRNSSTWVFDASVNLFLGVMGDLEQILYTHLDFRAVDWITDALADKHPDERHFYEKNAINQITLWGPNGEISDYASKQWAELIRYYYKPRWIMFLEAALDSKKKNEEFDEKRTQSIIRTLVEQQLHSLPIAPFSTVSSRTLAQSLYHKWIHVSDFPDLPLNVIRAKQNENK